jgi:hypothetical protein
VIVYSILSTNKLDDSWLRVEDRGRRLKIPAGRQGK